MKTTILSILFILCSVFAFAQNVNYYITIANDYTGTSHNLSGRMYMYPDGVAHIKANRIGEDTFHYYNTNAYGQNVYYCSLPLPNPNQEIFVVDAYSHDPEWTKCNHWHGQDLNNSFTNFSVKDLGVMTLVYDLYVPDPK